jgi:hypothetical protein
VPSSISSSDRYARQTAADRPGIAQPVPLRPVPEQPWGKILLGATLIFLALLAGWEAHWRAFGVTPGVANSSGLWAMQRRRLDAGEGDATVIVGSSRPLFDIQLPVWERLAGRRPIQLALEGTSPLVFVEDLAADPSFTGSLIIGIDPQVFFRGPGGLHADVLAYTRKELPSQRIGQWLSMHLIEPYLAFDDPDFALETVLARQRWPVRPGNFWPPRVRRLADHEVDRNTHLWSKVADDPQYRELARSIWRQRFQLLADGSSAELHRAINEQIDRTAKAVAKLRARGVRVLFLRSPSDGEFLAYERRVFPRATTWDVLLTASGAPGIHFEDYPELQGYELPEWSHLKRAEAERYTVALYGVIQRDFWGPHPGATSAQR